MNRTPMIAPAGNWSRSPLLWLLITGALLGTMLPFGQVARAAGWSPLAFVFWPALVAGVALLISGRSSAAPNSAPVPLVYSLVVGLLSVAVPNSIAFFVLPSLGTGTTGLLYTLPPLFTYALACLIGIEMYRPLRLLGILVGLGGTALLMLSRSTIELEFAGMLLLALLVPLSIASGNLYRKRFMPARVNSASLAGGMLIGAAVALLPLLLATGGWRWPGEGGIGVLLAQCVFSVLAYRAYFRFQKLADPVYFSQLGYVMAATGVLAGLAFFGEVVTPTALTAMAVIACGVALVNLPSRWTAT